MKKKDNDNDKDSEKEMETGEENVKEKEKPKSKPKPKSRQARASFLSLSDMKSLKAVEGIINHYHHEIHESFVFYAAQDNAVAMMSVQEMKQFIKDCKIGDPRTIGDAFLKKAFMFAAMTAEEYAENHNHNQHQPQPQPLSRKHQQHGSNTNDNGDRELSEMQFMELLVRLAWKKYHHNHSMSPAEKLELLLTQHLVRFSQSANELRDQIQSKAVSKVLSVLQKQLFEVFCYYAARVKVANSNNNDDHENNSGASVDSSHKTSPLLHFDGYLIMLDELHFNFTKQTFRAIFRRAQYQDDKQYAVHHHHQRHNQNMDDANNNSSSSTAIYKSIIDFDCFLESLVVVAIYKKPDPYIQLATRVEDFLINHVINPLFNRNRISHGAKMIQKNQTTTTLMRVKHRQQYQRRK